MLSGLSGYVKGVKKAIGNMGAAHQSTPTLGKIRIGSRNIEEIKLISQGGYAYVFQVRDAQTGEIFALKKMICQSPERLQTAKNEINYLRSLPDHPNLLKVFDTHVDNRDGCYYVYVLLEFCADGSIFDLMAKYESSRLSEKQIVFIMREVCEGVKALHSMKPAIAHRDLKIENVLLNNKRFKLCDFGSCSTSVVDFAKVPQSQYHNYEEEYDKNTTLMYRPPEMCDPYQKLIVSEKVDVWMIGCILYTMCFYKHPFQEMSKLSIVNAAYTFPNEKDHSYDPKLIDIIRICLTPNPTTRPSIFDLCKIFENYFELNGVKLNADAQKIKEQHRKQAQEMAKFENNSSSLRKFNGDIPVHELMKLQQQLAHDEDSSPVHLQNKARMSQKQASHGKLNSHKNSSDFDGFGDFNKKSQVPDPHQFHSSPGLGGNNNKDWFNFDEKPQNTNHQSNHQSSFAPNKNNQVNAQWQNFDFGSNGGGNKNSSSSNQQQPNNQWNSLNQNQNQNQSQAKPTQTQQQQQPNLMDQDFNPNHSNKQGFNNNNNNWGNNNMNNPQMQMQKQMQMQQMNQGGGWNNQNMNMNNMNNRMPMNNNFNNMNGWNNQNMQNMQMQNNNVNRMQQQQQGMNQMNNNGWNNMGGGFQQNNNMQSNNQNSTTNVTNNLLDLADNKPVRLDTASGIMSLYGKK